MNEILKFFILCFGFFLIWTAVGIGRKEESEIKIFSKNWWIVMLLICVGFELAIYGQL